LVDCIFPTIPYRRRAAEAELRVLLDEQCLVIVDEAYAEFAAWTAVPLLARYPNLVVMRTFRHAARGSEMEGNHSRSTK
jgi:histidinol-phosphate/aromatic aminotransferase/cobyric acid decarboxylase-like protein